ncbi:glutamyl-tRNA reductase [Aquicella lusitana]|uniref:Glutamyl-tRNA reductase n=1 Tax=Aquicella lusitana TaxID=254246 RepID=A0A370H0V4_9COXI|nr:glutamyl-tRNA reductase [Aquicella lusitana]RDI48604.1 glutamyl-tRNA reductase [Aquicella lusitana]VVC74019.1 Glutamyl-tRNA reductase [Aquicella lusitana]
MSIFAIGINHKTAPITLREKVYFAQDLLSLYLQDLLNRGYAQEAVLLSTCNRSELYCCADDIHAVHDWFCAQTSLSREALAPAIYTYRDEEAIAHIMQVACGLDSMVLGEPQILGQMKEAFSESCAASAVSTAFHALFQQVFAVAKEIRTTTAIGACPVSVASAAVYFARQRLVEFAQANVVLIGAGDTTELLIRYLQPLLSKPVTLVNRSTEKAASLAETVGGHVYGLEELSTALAQADIVFSATGSAQPIVKKEMMAEATRMRQEKPTILIDIAVPRDIEPAVADLENVELYCIDDLKAIIEKNRQGREHAAEKAREMIRKKSIEFLTELRSLDKVAHTIRAYRGQIEDICHAELTKARQQLRLGSDPAEVLDAFARAFIKKLLHTPSVQLRQAGAEGRYDLLRFAKQLFAIPDPETERL